MSRRVYLAGPDVFLPGFGAEIFAHKKRLCTARGFEGVSPMDNELETSGIEPFEHGLAIYRANVELMRTCDAVIANMTPFRGVSMDTGTAFEMGFMLAAGKPVLGYTNVVENFYDRSQRYYAANAHAALDSYSAHTSIERFDMADNLMMVGAVEACGFKVVRTAVPPGRELEDVTGFKACLDQLARHWNE